MAQNDDVDKLLDEMLKGKTTEEILDRGGVLKRFPRIARATSIRNWSRRASAACRASTRR